MVKNPPGNGGDTRDTGSIPGLGRSSGGGNGNPTPAFLPGESHGQRSLEGYSPWGHTVRRNLATKKQQPFLTVGFYGIKYTHIGVDPEQHGFKLHSPLIHGFFSKVVTAAPHNRGWVESAAGEPCVWRTRVHRGLTISYSTVFYCVGQRPYFRLEFRAQLYWAAIHTTCRTFPPAQAETLCPLSANPQPLLPSPWGHQLLSALRL